MAKIIGVLRPFQTNQSIYVFEDGNKLDATNVKIDEFPDSILAFVKQYNASQVDLSGPKKYAKGIQHQIEEIETAKYQIDNLKINII